MGSVRPLINDRKLLACSGWCDLNPGPPGHPARTLVDFVSFPPPAQKGIWGCSETCKYH